MSEITLEFDVSHTMERGPHAGSMVRLTSLRTFWKIASLGFKEEFGVGMGNAGGFFRVRGLDSDSNVQDALEMLADEGILPCHSTIVPLDERFSKFSLKKRRTYSDLEIIEAPYLSVRARFCESTLADFVGGSDDSGWIVENVRTNKNLIGHFDTFEALLMRDCLKEDIASSGLRTCGFVPVCDRSGTDSVKLWQFGHEIQMPRCITSQQNDIGANPSANAVGGRYWDDSGFIPEELSFDRREVEKMPAWDVARTFEKAGPNPRMLHSEIIVTQSFRLLLQQLRVTTINYVPVRLSPDIAKSDGIL